MLTKTILGEAIGVQHGGIQDRTSSNTVQGITHGLIIGKFKRGRTDQPMRINKDTIKARLGYEPNNPFYQVVQDCVDKFPSVWVLRVGVSTGGGGVVVPPVEQISCEGATDSMRFSWFGYDYELWVDDIYYPSESNPASTIGRELSDILLSADDGFWSVINLDSVPHRIRLVRRPDGQEFDYTVSGGNENQSFMEQPDGSLVFCLAPAVHELTCAGKSNYFVISSQNLGSYRANWKIKVSGDVFDTNPPNDYFNDPIIALTNIWDANGAGLGEAGLTVLFNEDGTATVTNISGNCLPVIYESYGAKWFNDVLGYPSI